jgi:hypothetical protein
VRWAALACALQAALAVLALTGCETSAERSATLEREAKVHGTSATQKGLSIARTSSAVSVVASAVVHSSEGVAVALRLRNASTHPLGTVPIAIVVKDASGHALFANDAPGLEASLTSVPSIPPRGELTWVDDQIPVSGSPVAVGVRLGEVPPLATRLPVIAVSRPRVIEDPSNGVGAAGTVTNRSQIAQQHLVVFVTASRHGMVVAAGRAVLAEVAASSSVPFQAFFIGDPRGAALQASAPPTTLR